MRRPFVIALGLKLLLGVSAPLLLLEAELIGKAGTTTDDRRLEARLSQAANRLAIDADILVALAHGREHLGLPSAAQNSWAALRQIQPMHLALRAHESEPAAIRANPKTRSY